MEAAAAARVFLYVFMYVCTCIHVYVSMSVYAHTRVLPFVLHKDSEYNLRIIIALFLMNAFSR